VQALQDRKSQTGKGTVTPTVGYNPASKVFTAEQEIELVQYLKELKMIVGIGELLQLSTSPL
jgi:hypothetical protein